MLKEINKDTAIAEFHEGKEILLYHTKLKRMFTSTELIECCRFLIEDETELSTIRENVEPEEIKQDAKGIEDKQIEDTSSVQLHTEEIASAQHVEEVQPDKHLKEKANDIDLNEIKRTPNNDVKTEVIDTGSDDQIDYNELIPGKKGRKITIDLGKLYSLR